MCHMWHTNGVGESVIEFPLRLKMTPEFSRWRDSLPLDLKRRVDARFDEFRFGHFGVSRALGDGLFELKWGNGMRVYFSRRRIGLVDSLVLWGGFKGTQDGDILKARRLKERYEDELENDAH